MGSFTTSLKESILGAKQDELIKSGTMVVTRGIGVIAVAFVGTFFLLDLLDQGPWASLNTWQKLAFVLAAAAVWSVVAAADAIARGIATAGHHELVATLPTGLTATKTKGRDDPGWSVVAIKFSSGEGSNDPEYLIVKPDKPAEWSKAEDLAFG